MENQKSVRKERVGVVVSDKMKKTIVVKIERLSRHPKYKKIIHKYRKFKVHDEEGKAKTGDKVRIAETKPISRDKRWRLIEVLSAR